MVPLIVFSDDTSGNSLPVAMNLQIQNIHFFCTSNKAPVMEMAAPLVEEFLSLEKGILMFDAKYMFPSVECSELDENYAPSVIRYMGNARGTPRGSI